MKRWLLLGVLALIGCKDVRIDSGVDARFLHEPSALFAALPVPTKPLLPAGVGSHWTYRLVEGESGIEEQVVTQHLPSGAITIEGRRVGQQAHLEFYQSTPEGIFQVGAGGKERLMMSPPIPLLRFPAATEKLADWQGGITIPSGSVPGRAWSLVRGMEKVTVPAGTFTAYRTDTTLEANINSQLSLFLTSRWFAPGVGIVKTRYVIRQIGQREQRFARELVRYKLMP